MSIFANKLNKMSKTIVINLFAGPGTGKSTSCAQIFTELKWKGINCEMALEFAKDKVWEESLKVLENQVYIFGKQFHRMKRLDGKVDVIITDSPLLFTLVYDNTKNINFKNFVIDMHKEFQNYNVFLEREKPYMQSGRLQDEKGARELDVKIKSMLEEVGESYVTVKANKEEISKITLWVIDNMNAGNTY